MVPWKLINAHSQCLFSTQIRKSILYYIQDLYNIRLRIPSQALLLRFFFFLPFLYQNQAVKMPRTSKSCSLIENCARKFVYTVTQCCFCFSLTGVDSKCQMAFHPSFKVMKLKLMQLLCGIAGPPCRPHGMGVAEVSREALILSQGARFHLLSILIKDSVNSVTGSRGRQLEETVDDKAVCMYLQLYEVQGQSQSQIPLTVKYSLN